MSTSLYLLHRLPGIRKLVNFNKLLQITSTYLHFSSRNEKDFHTTHSSLEIVGNALPHPKFSHRKTKNRQMKQREIDDILTNEVLYGRSVCNIALKMSRRAIFRLYLLKSWEDPGPTDPKVIESIELAKQRRIPIVYKERKLLDQLAFEKPHQGVCLEVGELTLMNLNDINIEKATASSDNGNNIPLWILLIGILDPMNIGAILRSSFYLGIDKVLVHGSCAPLTPVVSKASSGAAEILPVYTVTSAVNTIKKLTENKWDAIGTVTEQQHIRDYSGKRIEEVSHADIVKPSLVIFGSEGSGIPEHVLKICTRLVTISPKIETEEKDSDKVLQRSLIGSLNVSTATAITLYELQKRRGESR